MPYWYYAGKTTACIDLPSEDDPKVSIPTVLVPRQRFHAPRASVHHLLNTKPPQIKLLPEPRVKKVAPAPAPAPVAAPAPVPAPAPAPAPKVSAVAPKSEPKVVKETKGHTNANSSEDVLASPSSDTEAEEAAVDPESDGVPEPEPEKKSSSSSRKKRRGR